MQPGDFFVESVLPLSYWIGISIIISVLFFSLRYFVNNKSAALYVLMAIILLVSFRMAFPVMFTSIIAYEPDSSHYLKIVISWLQNGIAFGADGNYEHDYPLAFLIAFAIIKLGVPTDLFFRFSPFIVYGLIVCLLYMIVSEILPNQKKIAAISIFFLSFSSLGYWLSVHYCPDLLGALFFFLSFYLSILFAKRGLWTFKHLMPLLISIILLILSHHLSTLYFILTTLGLAFSTWFFKHPQFKGKAISFFILGIFTYTIWFAYGTLLYPKFFNIYIYFSGFGSPTELVQQASFLSNVTFIIYPAFMFALFIINIFEIFKFKTFKQLFQLKSKIKKIRFEESTNASLVFGVGFILILALFLLGFALPVSFPTRVLELLLIGLFPLSSQVFLKIYENSSKYKVVILVILFLIVLFVALTGIHRYYSQIQNRVISIL